MIEKPLHRKPESREDMPDYENSGLSVDDRLEDLLSRMTIQEKVAQLVYVWQKKQTTCSRRSNRFSARNGYTRYFVKICTMM
jgi:beta-glucosidase